MISAVVTPRIARLAALVAVGTWLAASDAAAGGHVRVGNEAVVERAEIALADLATFVGLAPETLGALAAISLGPAPELGQSRVLSGAELADRIRAVAPEIEISVPDQITIRPAERQIDAALVQDRLTRAVQARMPWRPEDVKLDRFALPAPFSVPAAATRLRVHFDERETFAGRVTARLEWVDPTHPDRRGVARSASVDVSVERPVVVATAALRRGAVIGDEMVTTERRDLRRVPDDALRSADAAIGQRLLVSVRPGSPIVASYLDAEALVERGDLVAVDAGSGALEILLMARALGRGRKGDIIRLQNPDSRETFPARVTGPRTAELALPGMSRESRR